MDGDVTTCARCQGRFDGGTIRVTIANTVGSADDFEPILDICRSCGNSLSRWLDKGRRSNPGSSETRVIRPRKHNSRSEQSRRRRKITIFAAEILFLLLAGIVFFKMLNRLAAVPEP